MEVLFIASIALIAEDTAESRKLFVDTLGLPLESYTVSRVYDASGKPHTAVDMKITVPTGLLFRYTVKDMVTSGLLGTGTVYALKYGTSGTPVHLDFTLSQA